MKKATFLLLILVIFTNPVKGFCDGKLSKDLDSLSEKLKNISSSTLLAKENYHQFSMLLNGRRAPYAMLYEHTGLFEWQLFPECFYEYEVDTTSYIQVSVEYKPNDDYFSTIPAYFYLNAVKPFSSLDSYRTQMIDNLKSLGTNINILFDQADNKYGTEGYHYCHSFNYNGTDFVADSYFVKIGDDVAMVYYMTSTSFYNSYLYKMFFDLVLDVLEFGNSSGTGKNIAQSPVSFSVSQNFPNPFNGQTQINYKINQHTPVTIQIFDSTGRLVDTILKEHQLPGSYTINYNASGLASGIYIYRISDDTGYYSNRMLLLK